MSAPVLSAKQPVETCVAQVLTDRVAHPSPVTTEAVNQIGALCLIEKEIHSGRRLARRTAEDEGDLVRSMHQAVKYTRKGYRLMTIFAITVFIRNPDKHIYLRR